MSRLCLLLVLIYCVNYCVARISYQDIRSYRNKKIVPDVLKDIPEGYLAVVYSKDNQVQARQGNRLSPSKLQDKPEIIWEYDTDESYTVMMFDPDMPGSGESPTSTAFLHWLIVNYSLDDDLLVTKANTIAEYIAPTPAESTSLHRYVFLIYKQSNELQYDEPSLTRLAENRAFFSHDEFAEKYNLGDPIAGNFCLAKFDTNV